MILRQEKYVKIKSWVGWATEDTTVKICQVLILLNLLINWTTLRNFESQTLIKRYQTNG